MCNLTLAYTYRETEQGGKGICLSMWQLSLKPRQEHFVLICCSAADTCARTHTSRIL